MGQSHRIEGVPTMTRNLLLIAIPLLPLALALLAPLSRSGLAMILGPLMALAAAMVLPENSSVQLPWLLTGAYWQLDSIGQFYLLFSAVIWLLATLYIIFAPDDQTRQVVYRSLFMLAMAGNMLLIVAGDMASFYLGFAMMGLSAYGLLLKPAQHARRAARVYLVFTLVGELALFSAMLILFSTSGSMLFSEIQQHSISDLAIALLLFGFGIKLALPGLHAWLPLTYSTAPLVSVAVLSGPMMNAGLLGWIRFLPAGAENLQTWGGVLVWIGVLGVLLGSILAMLQRRASAILAYSSIAKMGLVSSMFGYALSQPGHAGLVISALILFATHHMLVKSALFFGLHSYQQSRGSRAIYVGLLLLSLSLAGLPFSGGSGAKSALEITTGGNMGVLLLLSGFLTALMMVHFLWTARHRGSFFNRMTARRMIPRLDPSLGWWMLLPVAWFGPFLPAMVPFESKSLLVTVTAVALYFYIRHNWKMPARQALVLQPGDIYHLLKPVRLVNPVMLRHDRSLLTKFRWPQRHKTKPGDNGSLEIPGLLWFAVAALLITSIVLTS
jgi:formate hydrogenlyase subunit 3/multisubunit Na+/H+ antiporter MnhD subunit